MGTIILNDTESKVFVPRDLKMYQKLSQPTSKSKSHHPHTKTTATYYAILDLLTQTNKSAEKTGIMLILAWQQ